MKTPLINLTRVLAISLVVVMAAFGYLAYLQYRLSEAKLRVETDLSQTKAELTETGEMLAETTTDRDIIRQKLIDQQTLVDSLAAEVSKIAGSVGIIEKIQRTDPELLQKYSKVFFLNEHYIPSRLFQIPGKYVFNPDRDHFFHADIWFYLQLMTEDALKAGVDIKILSAYRSFGTQADLKSSYKVVYGSGANQFSADQGYSEHQLATAVDFTNTTVGSVLLGFEKTKAYEWLSANAYRYGFILSYPKDNTYYEYEPWHWRFVGRSLASKLHAENKNFYDVDQREIDEYLVSFFD